VQHLEGVAGAVADGQHDMPAHQALAIGQFDADHLAVFAQQPVDLGFEADLAAQFDDVARMFSTILTRRKVPMCGLLT
jgi:hypothetical protein